MNAGARKDGPLLTFFFLTFRTRYASDLVGHYTTACSVCAKSSEMGEILVRQEAHWYQDGTKLMFINAVGLCHGNLFTAPCLSLDFTPLGAHVLLEFLHSICCSWSYAIT